MNLNKFIIQRVKIRAGQSGVVDTVNLMNKLVHEYKANIQIRELAFSLIENVESKDFVGEIEALFNFVRDNIRYTQDIYDLETLANPLYTIDKGHGDCDDHCVLLASLMQSIGHVTMFVTAGYDLDQVESHIYLWTVVDGVEIYLDPTEKNEPMGFEPTNPVIKAFWG